MGLSQFQIKLLQFIDFVRKNPLNFREILYIFLDSEFIRRIDQIWVTVLIFAHCENSRNFMPLRFSVKSTLANLESQKMPYFSLLVTVNFNFRIFHSSKNANFVQIQKIIHSKNGQNCHFWYSEFGKNWFHVKSEWQKNSWISTPLCSRNF